MIIALTGATGFLGGAVLERLLVEGHRVRALARRAQRERAGVTWVPGDLADSDALAVLVEGAEATIHVAGAINVANRAAFHAANAVGTRLLAEKARDAGVERFVLVSSLSAREPELSDYGWSKGEAEHQLVGSDLDWTIVRPPAIYGPGDREMLEMFRMASHGFLLLPPPGRLSIIHADDLARLLVILAMDRSGETCGKVYEVDDGTPGGFTHVGFAQALGEAVGRRVRTLSLPAWVMMLAARGDRLARGSKAKLTPDRARYFCHPDWVSAPDAGVPHGLWQPAIGAREGLAETAAGYRAKGWLR